MGAVANDEQSEQLNFDGLPPQPVRCRWFANDELRAHRAEVIRLVLDNTRGLLDPVPNDIYNRNIIREIRSFIGATNALIVTPAGMIKASVEAIEAVPASLPMIQELQQNTIDELDLGGSGLNLMLGVDLCVRDISVPVQTVIYLHESTKVELSNVTIKLHPVGNETRYLFGRKLCDSYPNSLPELLANHAHETTAGKVLNMVCHEANLFGGRSESKLESTIGTAIREYFREVLSTSRAPKYVLIPTHWQDNRGGPAFVNAISNMCEEFHATIVVTFRGPTEELDEVAARFAVRGPNADSVVTLIVEDTYYDRETP